MSKHISELDQKLLANSINKLHKFKSPKELIRFWNLFGPCVEKVPEPEVNSPWSAGLDL
jgi:hypothetical protein